MPKVENTRAQRAMELLQRLERGPSFTEYSEGFTAPEASRQYQGWAEAWIIEELKALVPELRKRGK
jgi:hypothetical protein